MTSGNGLDQNQAYRQFKCIARPAAFNSSNKTAYFPMNPRALTLNESHMRQNLNPQKHRILTTECSMIRYPGSMTHHISGVESRMTQVSTPLENQLHVNELNVAKDSNILVHQPSSNRDTLIQSFPPPIDLLLLNRSNMTEYSRSNHNQLPLNRTHMIQNVRSSIPITNELPKNESNNPQQAYIQAHQLPINMRHMDQDSILFMKKLLKSASCTSMVKHSAMSKISQSESRKDPSFPQQFDGECNVNHGLLPIFQNPPKYGLDILQNPTNPGQNTFERQVSFSSSNNLPRVGFNINQDLPSVHHYLLQSDISLNENLYPQYSEKVHICVIGPPKCGKADLIRTYLKNDVIRLSTDKPLKLVAQEEMECFGTALKMDIWLTEDLTPAYEDLRSLCISSKSVIVLVYSKAQISTLSTVVEWIKVLKYDLSTKVPIILVGNETDVRNLFVSKEHSEVLSNLGLYMDGFHVKKDFNLAAFYEFSIECVLEVEVIFLIAAYLAFNRQIPTSI